MRADINISIAPIGSQELGTRVEINGNICINKMFN